MELTENVHNRQIASLEEKLNVLNDMKESFGDRIAKRLGEIVNDANSWEAYFENVLNLSEVIQGAIAKFMEIEDEARNNF